MPLIMLTGLPTSGKSYRAHQLQDYFLKHISAQPADSPTSSLRVHLISDHTLCIPRAVYNLESKTAHERSNNTSEKESRASIYAAVKRVLTNKDIVILDGANYIKGWRYQLYCEAKAVQTPHCVVHVGTPIDRARNINEQRLAARNVDGDDVQQGSSKSEEEKPYEKECWENLVFRYEEPNAMTRWDSPLFTIIWDDETPPYDAIWEAMIGNEDSGRKVVKPNQATVLKAGSGKDYLYELDRHTQEILSRILEWTKDHPGEGGGEVAVGEGLVVELPANPQGLPALQRHRRQFITLNRTIAIQAKRLRESYVAYLNDVFKNA